VATEVLTLEQLTTPESHPAPALVSGGAPAPAAAQRPRLDFGGTLIDRVDRHQALERIRGFLHAGQPQQVVTVNLDFLSIAERDAAFRAVINGAGLAVADGMPLVWLSRLRGEPLAERVAGVELVDAACALAARTGDGVFLLGAAPGVARTAAERLVERHPGLRIAGTYSPPMGPLKRKHNQQIVRMIREAAPGFLFVALGAPRQDLWIAEHLHELNVPVAMGVGCVFDLLAGVTTRAPSWMQAAGLEWSWRLLREPRRLWRRYILNDLPVFGRLLLSGRRSAGQQPIVVPT
jgi:N-acetylglucosaminyldiphosphoundecaprenol N-acetyl-beta-D-mannosaminyltransferase